MESERPERKLFEALEAAEPQQAATALGDLTARGVAGISPAKLWTRFKRLLHRRGYYVETPAQLSASLDEIAAIGEGFDLYELARSLAAYDGARAPLHRFRPELQKEK